MQGSCLSVLIISVETCHSNEIEAVTMEVGIKEQSWVKDISKFKDGPTVKSDKKPIPQNINSMTMKLIVGKSKNKVLYAEAGVELVDPLFSFLEARGKQKMDTNPTSKPGRTDVIEDIGQMLARNKSSTLTINEGRVATKSTRGGTARHHLHDLLFLEYQMAQCVTSRTFVCCIRRS
ncbi:hypothetical protein RND71_018981 [Anisodus tanguticus]|uniref:Uncharacterized protein n=1 Tax=Anisodus tanguticus TaxID=243964 RepID=A0AAE1S5L8_9SOLA|nr:hypothetical protein RND71_018981 [Anisodus tanguticus]